MKFLITGGAGYIGSTLCSALEDAGHTPIILDSLVTGREEFTHGRIFYHANIADEKAVERIFREHPDIQATVHCAALIVVPDSVSQPYEYYHENVVKSLDFFTRCTGWGKSEWSSVPPPQSMIPSRVSWSLRSHRSNLPTLTPVPSS